MGKQRLSLDEVMLLVRRGEVQVCLVEHQLFCQFRQRDASLVAALHQHEQALIQMLHTSDTRLCMNVPEHAAGGYYHQSPPWYSCSMCAHIRQEWGTQYQKQSSKQACYMAS